MAGTALGRPAAAGSQDDPRGIPAGAAEGGLGGAGATVGAYLASCPSHHRDHEDQNLPALKNTEA